MKIRAFLSLILTSILVFGNMNVLAGHCNTADGHSHEEKKEKDRNY